MTLQSHERLPSLGRSLMHELVLEEFALARSEATQQVLGFVIHELNYTVDKLRIN